jgi:ubiquinone/menaquinone biosynthesis C-methylase UbiE
MKFVLGGGHSALVIDINQEMIEKGKAKYVNNDKISWKIASAENLPIPENTFERASMGFGLRNITNRIQSLKEVYRILKPGGRFICLEFSHVENSLLKKLYDIWSFRVYAKNRTKNHG